MHLLIPFAFCRAQACLPALRGLTLPHLESLLARLTPVALDAGGDDTLSPPHERVLAQALGLAAGDGRIPWAAWQVASSGSAALTASLGAAWGFITPCHWQVNQAHITLSHPDALDLQEDESRALLAAMRPYFEEDGIELVYDHPTRWLARGEVFRDLATASLDRVVGRDIRHWIPTAPRGAPLRRLQNEMQMLLYTHPVNDARAARGLLPVNSFWVSGTGALHAASVVPPDTPIVPRRLADAALRDDWAAWRDAWQTTDVTECAALLRALEQPGPPGRATLTLCGERKAQTYAAARRRVLSRITGIVGRKSLPHLLEQL